MSEVPLNSIPDLALPPYVPGQRYVYDNSRHRDTIARLDVMSPIDAPGLRATWTIMPNAYDAGNPRTYHLLKTSINNQNGKTEMLRVAVDPEEGIQFLEAKALVLADKEMRRTDHDVAEILESPYTKISEINNRVHVAADFGNVRFRYDPRSFGTYALLDAATDDGSGHEIWSVNTLTCPIGFGSLEDVVATERTSEVRREITDGRLILTRLPEVQHKPGLYDPHRELAVAAQKLLINFNHSLAA